MYRNFWHFLKYGKFDESNQPDDVRKDQRRQTRRRFRWSVRDPLDVADVFADVRIVNVARRFSRLWVVDDDTVATIVKVDVVVGVCVLRLLVDAFDAEFWFPVCDLFLDEGRWFGDVNITRRHGRIFVIVTRGSVDLSVTVVTVGRNKFVLYRGTGGPQIKNYILARTKIIKVDRGKHSSKCKQSLAGVAQ